MTLQRTHVRRIFSLIPIIVLLSSSFVAGRFSANLLDVVSAGTLSPGDYAWYTPSNLSLTHLAGYAAFTHVPYTTNQLYLNDYKTDFPYSSFIVGWKIESVRQDTYLVNYTVLLSGLQGDAASKGRIMEDVVVSRQNNTVYSTNGTALGSWPYWLANRYLAPGATLTLIHDFTEFITNSSYTGPAYFTETAFTSLPQGSGEPNKTATQDFVDSSLNLGPQGTFVTDRLLITYPYFFSGPCGGVTSPGVSCVSSNPIWVGVYDRPSGILLSQDHDFWFIDDILLHSDSGIGQIGFSGLSLILSSTNLNLNPDAKPGGSTLWIPAVVVVGLIAVFGVATVFVVHRRSKPQRR